jgi:UDP-N-acetyl-D-mannosaminuronic acid dehydrogenase
VLGLAFKGDTDDERDSLAHKLVRLLERELADVAVHDPLVASPTQPLEETLREAHVVVVAANHAAFEPAATRAAISALAASDCLVVDPWNHLGSGQVFAFADELAPLAAGEDRSL